MSYLITPTEQFTPEQRIFMDKAVDSIIHLSESTSVIAGIKDVHSRHLISTDAYANLVAFECGADVAGHLDREMPNEGTACFADKFVQEDLALLECSDPYKTISVLNVHYYGGDELEAKVFFKKAIRHDASKALLGVHYSARDVDMGNLIWLLQDYQKMFGPGCSIQQTMGDIAITHGQLTAYEQKVCFFLLLNWNAKHIQDYLDKIESPDLQNIQHTIGKISEKLGLSSARISVLRDKLISMDMQTRMPQTLFQNLIGSWVLQKIPV